MGGNMLNQEEVDSLVRAIFEYQIERSREIIVSVIDNFVEGNSEARNTILRKYTQDRLKRIREEVLKLVEEITKKNSEDGLSNREKAYLAAVAVLLEDFQLPLVIAPLPYEMLRCIGLEKEVSVVDRSMRGLEVLENLEAKGLLKYEKPKFEWKIAAGKPKYFFNLTDEGERIAKNSEEYKLLKQSLNGIKDDERFKDALEKFKSGFRQNPHKQNLEKLT